MKKILNILVILSFCCISKAQTTAIDTNANFRNNLFNSGKLSFGIKAGLSYSTLYGKEIGYVFADNNATYKPGYHFGITVDNKIGKHFWLKHELIFNQRIVGVQLSDSVNGQYNSKLKMSYLQLQPANAAFCIEGVQLYAGPYISTLLGAQVQRKENSGNIFSDHSIFGTPDNDESQSKYLQKFDFGINAGLEYQLPMGLSISVKYTHGLTDIFQYANSYASGDTKTDKIKIYNRGFMISIGYSFKNKRNEF